MTWTVPQKSRLDLESAGYLSLGLKALLDMMQENRKHFILDLGPALGTNVEFWSRFPCRIYIEDFYRNYRNAQASSSEEAGMVKMEELLPQCQGISFDIILAWDLLNYLDQEELALLVRHLMPACRPGTLLFALISSHSNMPEEPCTYRIIDPERMICAVRTDRMRACPRYHPKDIARLMTPFSISSSFLLRNGTQEYVFVCK
jgi:hypothetical protein